MEPCLQAPESPAPVGLAVWSVSRSGEGWVPPTWPPKGWLCPLGEGRESCLVACPGVGTCCVVSPAPCHPGAAPSPAIFQTIQGSPAPLTSRECSHGWALMQDDSATAQVPRGAEPAVGVSSICSGTPACPVYPAHLGHPSPMGMGTRLRLTVASTCPESRCREGGRAGWQVPQN